MMTKNAFNKRTRSYASSKSDFLLRRLTSPGLIPGPTNSFPVTSATASASSPSLTGTLLRTNSMAASLSASYARKFRTIQGFPSASNLVTRMFHPAGILGNMRPKCCSSMAPYSGPGRGFEHSEAQERLTECALRQSGRLNACSTGRICLKIAVLEFIALVFQRKSPDGAHSTSAERASSVLGRMQTAIVESSGAANPHVPVLKLWVVRLSPTFAGRDLTWCRL